MIYQKSKLLEINLIFIVKDLKREDFDLLRFGCIEKMNLRCVKIEDIKYSRNKVTFQMKVMVLKNLMPENLV